MQLIKYSQMDAQMWVLKCNVFLRMIKYSNAQCLLTDD